jgi:hypothetical protein
MLDKFNTGGNSCQFDN